MSDKAPGLCRLLLNAGLLVREAGSEPAKAANCKLALDVLISATLSLLSQIAGLFIWFPGLSGLAC